MSVVYAIECDAAGFSSYVSAESHAEMSCQLIYKGWSPIGSFLLCYTDSDGRDWDAMPAVFPPVQAMKPAAEMTVPKEPK